MAQFGGRGSKSGNSRAHGAGSTPTPDIPAKPAPRQRLDIGALLCNSQAALSAHQAAIQARLDGKDAPETAGCRIVTAMTPVTIVERPSQAATEVRLPGPPEQTGWTDAVIAAAAAPR